MSILQKRNFPKQVSKPFAGIKSFCKVCHDAGKTESEYTSHFVKSEPGLKGVVVCPTLLAQPCIYCHTPGHTVSYCDVRKKKIRMTLKTEYKNDQNKKTVEYKPKKNISRFDILVEDVEEVKDVLVEDVKQVKLKRTIDEAFPALCESRAQVTSLIGDSYANIAAKPAAPVKKPETHILPVLIVKHINARNNAMKRWADWSDSESDDEETYNVNLK